MSFTLQQGGIYDDLPWDEHQAEFENVEFDSRRDWFSVENRRVFEQVLESAQAVDSQFRTVADERTRAENRAEKRTPEEMEDQVHRVERELDELRSDVKRLTDLLLHFTNQFFNDVNTWMDLSGMSAYDVHDEDLPKNRRNHIRRAINYFRDCVVEQGIDAVLADENFEDLHDKVTDEFFAVVAKIEENCLAFLRIIREVLRDIIDVVAHQTVDTHVVAEEILANQAMNATDSSGAAVKWSSFVAQLNAEVEEGVTEEDAFDVVHTLHRAGGSGEVLIDYDGICIWDRMDDSYEDGPTAHVIMDDEAHRDDEDLKDEFVNLRIALDLPRFNHPSIDDWASYLSVAELRAALIDEYKSR